MQPSSLGYRFRGFNSLRSLQKHQDSGAPVATADSGESPDVLYQGSHVAGRDAKMNVEPVGMGRALVPLDGVNRPWHKLAMLYWGDRQGPLLPVLVRLVVHHSARSL
jgi:hypothetical protein